MRDYLTFIFIKFWVGSIVITTISAELNSIVCVHVPVCMCELLMIFYCLLWKVTLGTSLTSIDNIIYFFTFMVNLILWYHVAGYQI